MNFKNNTTSLTTAVFTTHKHYKATLQTVTWRNCMYCERWTS